MNKMIYAAFALALPSLAHADVTAPRIVIDTTTIASGGAVPVQGDVGLLGATRRRALPAVRANVDSSSTCTRDRRGSIMSYGTDASLMASTAEIVTIGGREYLDEANLVTNTDHVKVESHTRRLVTRIADLGEGAFVWAYRDNGWIVVGTFADFGQMDRMTTLGCRWQTFSIFARGGTGRTVSHPRFSDPITYGLSTNGPQATGPSFSIAASVSRSSAEASPMLVLRAMLIPDNP